MSAASVVTAHRYDGSEGFHEKSAPTLAIAYENGRAQIMKNERDESPVLIDTLMKISRIHWSPTGTVLAFAGTQVFTDEQERDGNVVQFYNAFGEHLRTLRV